MEKRHDFSEASKYLYNESTDEKILNTSSYNSYMDVAQNPGTPSEPYTVDGHP